MKKLQPHTARRLLTALLLAGVAVVASTATAGAAVYCVHDPECPAGGIAEDTLAQAAAGANEDAAEDVVRIGPGTFSTPPVSLSKPVRLVGAGMHSTMLEDASAGGGSFLYVSDGGSKVSDLSVRLSADGQEGMRLMNGADVERVKVEAPHELAADGIMVEGASEISSVVVDVGPGLANYGIGDLGTGATIFDATLTAGLGLVPSDAGTIARRLTIRATYGLYVVGGVLNLANALITPYPGQQESGFVAAEVVGGNGGEGSLLNLADATIVGPGPGNGGWGVVVRSNPSKTVGNVSANLQGVIVEGVQVSLERHGKSVTQTADLAVSHSAYDGATVADISGNGTFDVGPGNLTGGVDPMFVDPTAGDYRLRFDSPLLDEGPPVEPLSSDDPDLAGRSRVRDSDGDGQAVRDIGAFEYQRLAPSAAFTLAPTSASIGEALAFEATGADPDGDPVTYSWDFGDGTAASGAAASHAYAAAGSYSPSLTATDATGLSANTTRTANVQAAEPPVPVLSNLSESARRWVPGAASVSKDPKTGKPVGTTFSFELNVAASVRVAFFRRAIGRKVAGRCVRRTAGNTGHARCKRRVAAGALSVQGRPGRNRVPFTGRIPSARMLRPGAYVASFTASDSAGRHSVPRSLGFRILKRR